MKVLVTGGCGFIGGHLCDLLVAKGHEVTVVDSLVGGRRRNIAAAEEKGRVRFVHSDVTDPQLMGDVVQGHQWVFHLAAIADIVPSIERPTDYFRANVDGTLSVLEASRKAGVERFVYAASSSCYGIPDVYPTPEDAPIRPQYPYALTKYMGEELVLHWGQLYDLPVVSLRLFNVYGPRVRTNGAYGAVFGVFLAQKLEGKPFTVVGDGKQTRDFTYVTDVAAAFAAAAESDVCGEVINIGSDHHYSVNYLVELLGGEVTYVPKRPGEPDCTFADVSKAKRLLNWHPEVGFEDGVRRMLDVIDDWKGAPVWTTETIETATKQWFRYLGNLAS